MFCFYQSEFKESFVNNRIKGKLGEEEAANYLLENGYTIISMNYESKAGEIDCIAKDPLGTIAFVEVKAAKSLKYGSPLFKINRTKQKQILQMAKLYLVEHSMTNVKCRFDAISVVNSEVKHIKNAFMA